MNSREVTSIFLTHVLHHRSRDPPLNDRTQNGHRFCSLYSRETRAFAREIFLQPTRR